MKRFRLLAAAAVLSLSLFSCSGSGPEGTAEKFITLTQQGNFTEAKKLCTEPTAQLLTMAEGMIGDKKEEMKEKNKDLKVEIVSSDIKENDAKVKYKVTGGEAGEDGVEKEIDLKKVDGDWKVNINKEGAQ